MRKSLSTMASVVKILNDGEFHDGTTLGSSLKISRNAVCKAIRKLNNYGIVTDSVKGKGYRMHDKLILLNKKTILENASDKDFEIDIFESVNSTNEYLKQYYGSPLTRICLTECQTNGKGRLKRSWHSPFGQNIYLSLLYRFQQDVSEMAGLSLVISLAIISALESLKLPKSAYVKWPNDIVYEGKKLAGTLIEIQAEANGFCSAIIGIGLNVNMISANIDQPWTSLRQISGEYIDRNLLCATLLDNIFKYLQKFLTHGFKHFIPQWRGVDYLYDKTINLQTTNAKVRGIAKGINEQGQLVLELSNGQIGAFSYGDTAVLK